MGCWCRRSEVILKCVKWVWLSSGVYAVRPAKKWPHSAHCCPHAPCWQSFWHSQSDLSAIFTDDEEWSIFMAPSCRLPSILQSVLAVLDRNPSSWPAITIFTGFNTSEYTTSNKIVLWVILFISCLILDKTDYQSNAKGHINQMTSKDRIISHYTTLPDKTTLWKAQVNSREEM